METDYIIHVNCFNGGKKNRPEPDFDSFIISKTFSAFRTLADQLHDGADALMNSKQKDIPRKVRSLANYCQVVLQLIDSQRTEYLGKVNYMYVKVLAKQRSQILNDVLDATLSNFPDETESHPFLAQVAAKIEAFFLTDHCASADEEEETYASLFVTPIKRNYQTVENKVNPKGTKAAPEEEGGSSPDSGIVDDRPPPASLEISVSSPVVPYTRKVRRSLKVRELDEQDLSTSGSAASLLLDNDRSAADLVPSYDAPVSTGSSSLESSWLGTFIDNNPYAFLVIFAISMQILRLAGNMVVTIDLDVQLLAIFAAFCLGLHAPRPLIGGVNKPPLKQARRPRRNTNPPGTPSNVAKLLRKSFQSSSPTSDGLASRGSFTLSPGEIIVEEMIGEMEAEVEEGEDDLVVRSPLPRFPEGAELGSILNCWSEPPAELFNVRGAQYLADKKKVKSGSYLFNNRGMDLFLTDACPENVGRISSLLGGGLRDVPTLIINFRLPWGVFLLYSEIAEQFVPYLKARYGDPSVNRKELEAKLETMSPSDRCTARFFLAEDEQKNKVLKIIPSVVEGPWVAKSVIGGKPALIANKMPTNYVYEPEAVDKNDKKAIYFEIDLDIVSSKTGRTILSVARTYTQDLTIDLGFVIQGNEEDELPEQMMMGTRLHGIDPINSPPLPPIPGMMFTGMGEESFEDDDTDGGGGDWERRY